MGNVTDPVGLAIAGVRVKVFDASGTLVGETLTNGMGRYEFSAPVGRYGPVRDGITGISRAVVDGITVSSGRENRQDARLVIGNTSRRSMSQRKLRRSEHQPPAFQQAPDAGLALDGRWGAARAGWRSQPQMPRQDPITIRKNRSALVPIVQSPIDAEKVSVWNDSAGLPRPERALWLENSTGLTLDGGSFSVLEEETFAGEGVFEPIRPGEKRLVSYAVDLAVNASSKTGSDPQRVTRVRVSNGVMTHVSEMRERKTYTFRNEDTSPRTVIVEHPARAGFELKSETRPAETTAGWMRFRLPLAREADGFAGGGRSASDRGHLHAVQSSQRAGGPVREVEVDQQSGRREAGSDPGTEGCGVRAGEPDQLPRGSNAEDFSTISSVCARTSRR